MDLAINSIGNLILLFLLGNIGIALAGTLLGAIVAFTDSQNYLFSILAFPIFLPIFLLLIQISTTVLSAGTITFSDYGLLVAYDVVLIGISSILFDYLWYE